jgi:hypothetical protein
MTTINRRGIFRWAIAGIALMAGKRGWAFPVERKSINWENFQESQEKDRLIFDPPLSAVPLQDVYHVRDPRCLDPAPNNRGNIGLIVVGDTGTYLELVYGYWSTEMSVLTPRCLRQISEAVNHLNAMRDKQFPKERIKKIAQKAQDWQRNRKLSESQNV